MNAAIAEIISGKTVIVIAHRLHSIVNADQICVMKDGEIAACDTHERLLASCGEYKKLWHAAQSSMDWKITAQKEVQA